MTEVSSITVSTDVAKSTPVLPLVLVHRLRMLFQGTRSRGDLMSSRDPCACSSWSFPFVQAAGHFY